MTRETILLLDTISGTLSNIRKKLDYHMYQSPMSDQLTDEDKAYCRKVYDAVCKVMDLL